MGLADVTFAVLDLELTGLDPDVDRIVEVGIVRGRRGGPVERWSTLVQPGVPMTPDAATITGLSDASLVGAPAWCAVADAVAARLDGAVIVGHRGELDHQFLARALPGRVAAPSFDTWTMARSLLSLRSHALSAVCSALGVSQGGAHRALQDAEATWGVFWAMVDLLDPDGALDLAGLTEAVARCEPGSAWRDALWEALEAAHAARETVWIDYLGLGPVGRASVSRREVALWALDRPRFGGWCFLRGAERMFRLDRVRAVHAGGRPVTIPAAGA